LRRHCRLRRPVFLSPVKALRPLFLRSRSEVLNALCRWSEPFFSPLHLFGPRAYLPLSARLLLLPFYHGIIGATGFWASQFSPTGLSPPFPLTRQCPLPSGYVTLVRHSLTTFIQAASFFSRGWMKHQTRPQSAVASHLLSTPHAYYPLPLFFMNSMRRLRVPPVFSNSRPRVPSCSFCGGGVFQSLLLPGTVPSSNRTSSSFRISFPLAFLPETFFFASIPLSMHL